MVPILWTRRRPRTDYLRPSRPLAAIVSLCILIASAALVAAGAAPPDPSKTSTVGQSVNNPATSTTTTVTALIVDPVGTPTAGTTAFVKTADGYIFLVKAVGEIVYNGDNPPLAFTILSKDTTTHTVQIQAPGQKSALALSYQVLLRHSWFDHAARGSERGEWRPGGPLRAEWFERPRWRARRVTGQRR
jgi:archaellum component FlaG (FlaF/FlaG flagellin family)